MPFPPQFLNSAFPFLSTQLHPYLRSTSFNNGAGDTIFLDENGQIAAGFDVMNWIFFPNKSLSPVKVGKVDPQVPSGKEFSINNSAITWHGVFKQVEFDM